MDEYGGHAKLVGQIGDMAALLPGAETVEREPYRSSVKVIAGECYYLYRTTVHWLPEPR